MSGPPSYGNDVTAIDRAVALRAAATVRRCVRDPAERLEVLAMLGLTGLGTAAAPRRAYAGPPDRTRSGSMISHSRKG